TLSAVMRRMSWRSIKIGMVVLLLPFAGGAPGRWSDVVALGRSPRRSRPRGTERPLVRDRPAPGAVDHSTTRLALRVTGRDKLKKLGEVAITASWISANCPSVPSPLMRTV